MPPENLRGLKVAYGAEFWRTPKKSGELNIAEAIDRVKHAFEFRDNRGWVTSKTYDAQLGEGGIQFSPRGASTTLVLGGASLEAAAGEPRANGLWRSTGNVAERDLGEGAGVVEHVQATGAGLELTWLLLEKPQGVGAVTLSVDVSGMEHIGEEGSTQLFGSGGEVKARIGEVVGVDSAGKRWALPSAVHNGRLLVEISAAVLGTALYPLAIDPLITADRPVGDPVDAVAWEDVVSFSVAHAGGRTLIVYSAPDYNGLPRCKAILMNSDGTRATRRAILLSPPTPEGEVNPVVAKRADGFLVVRTRGSTMIASRMDADGEISGTEPVGNLSGYPNALLPDGDGYLLVFMNSSGIRMAQRLSESGQPIGLSTALPSNNATLAKGPGGYLAVATHSDETGMFIRCNRLDEQLQPVGEAIKLGLAQEGNDGPTVTSDGSNYLVSWQVYSPQVTPFRQRIDLALISPTGTVITQTGVRAEADEQSAHVWWDGEKYLLWHQNWVEGDSEKFVSRIDPATLLLTETHPVLRTSRRSQLPQTAHPSSGTTVLVWLQSLDRESLVAATFSDTSTVIGPINIADNVHFGSALAAYEDGYLLVWQDNRNSRLAEGDDIYATRLDREGRVLDPMGLALCVHPANQTTPVLAYMNNQFLVGWRDTRNSDSSGDDIYAARVARSGEVLDPGGFPVSRAPQEQRGVTISASKEQFLAVWRDSRNNYFDFTREPQFWSDDIYAARITFGGVLRDPEGIQVASNSFEQSAPSVASLGDSFCLVWREETIGNPDIRMNMLSANGTLQFSDSATLSDPLQIDRAPEIAAGSSNYLAVWRTGAGIAALRLSAAGEIDGTPIILGGNRNAREPDVAFDGTRYQVSFLQTESSGYSILGATVDPETGRPSRVLQLRWPEQIERDTYNIAAVGPNRFVGLFESIIPLPQARAFSYRFLPEIRTIARTEAGVRITWDARIGAQYQVEAGDQLSSLQPVSIVTAAGAEADFSDDSARTQRFYRIQEL